jgi:hypothetical protein
MSIGYSEAWDEQMRRKVHQKPHIIINSLGLYECVSVSMARWEGPIAIRRRFKQAHDWCYQMNHYAEYHRMMRNAI